MRTPRRTERMPAYSSSDAIVIGAGFGGIAAALRLRRRGYRVTVLEALDQPGGRARAFHRNGFTFDAGPTVITAPFLIDELFALFGKRTEEYVHLVPVEPFYRILFPDGSEFDYYGDEERLIAQIEAFNPPDVDGYRRLAAHAERIFEVGFTRLADHPFDRPADMLQVIPEMIRLSSHRSVYSLVAQYIRDERLRQAFTFESLLVGGNPFTASSIYLLIHWLERKWGVHFAMGGTTALIRALTRLMEEVGIELRLETGVERILVGAGGVTGVMTVGGEHIRADIVVANADPSRVYSQMIDRRHRRRHSNRAIRRVRQSMSLFVAYFGFDRSCPELAHHTIVLGPRYRELLDAIFRKRVLSEDVSLYLHAPARTDPSLAPAGKECLYVLSPVPNLRAGIDWEREAEPYFERIRAELERRMLPDLGARILDPFFLTPRDFEHTLNSADGAAFGPEPILRQSAYFRYHNRSEDVRGLYFVGAGTHPGAGIPGVLSSARVLDRIVPAPAGVEIPAEPIRPISR